MTEPTVTPFELLSERLRRNVADRDEALKAIANHMGASTSALEAAKLVRSVAIVWMARTGYLTATHVTIASKRHPMNITAAAKKLGMAYGTLSPYVLAGQALANKGRVKLMDDPEQVDIDIVEKSFDDGARADRKAIRAKAKAEKAAKELAGSAGATAEVIAEATLTGASVLEASVRLLNTLGVFLQRGGKLSDAERAKLEGKLGEAAALIA
ncbi:hypothetical protein AB0N24_07170 [Arthrobacter sp. NPDC093128]|uniref:hypothetical protein n=1 Tax=Arthrobacter sp. NPDC093128 TaxID=3154979 RepID=UPI00341433E7